MVADVQGGTQTRPEGVEEAIGALKVSLTDEEDKEIRGLVEKADVKGGRYWAEAEGSLFQ